MLNLRWVFTDKKDLADRVGTPPALHLSLVFATGALLAAGDAEILYCYTDEGCWEGLDAEVLVPWIVHFGRC